MWVTGSYPAQKTTELVDLSDSTISAELPYKIHVHCATQLNSTHGIITGGYEAYYGETLIVDLNDFTITTGPTLQAGRNYYHACTRISAVNGTDYAIVAGGAYTPDTSEIMDGNSWKYGKH